MNWSGQMCEAVEIVKLICGTGFGIVALIVLLNSL